MIDSNRTLRFNRTAKETYGYDVSFEEDKSPLIIVGALSFIFGFLVGVAVI